MFTGASKVRARRAARLKAMAKKHGVCAAAELPPGAKKVVRIGARRIGVFNVGGEYFALADKCPHQGASICDGPICGTNAPVDEYRYDFTMQGEIVRCSRHGWEFNIKTGECVGVPGMRTKTYPAAEENGEVFVTL